VSKLILKTLHKKRANCVIAYATETGKSEQFAKALFKSIKLRLHTKVVLNQIIIFSIQTSNKLSSQVICLNDLEIVHLERIEPWVLLVITSTFGNGEAPENGNKFKHLLLELLKEGKK